MAETKRGIPAVGPIKTPAMFNQLGILVLDGSGSMKETTKGNITKAEAVNDSVRNVLTRFKRSRHVRNFSFAVVTFDDQAKVHTPVTAAVDLNDDGDFDPLRDHGGATDIGGGLVEAKRIAGDFLRKAPRDAPSSVVIVVMSDGRDGDGGVGDPEQTIRIAEEIKSNPAITICSTYFAGIDSQGQSEQDNLRSIASDPSRHYKTVSDAESLRTFFIASLSLNTGVMI